MTLRLSDLDACFEGVVPAVIATLSAEGVPNISYLSHVARVDDRHIALSNQFFGKTAGNLAAVPRAAILLVDGRSGQQYRAETLFVRSESEGPLFDRVAAQIAATSAQVGMASVMHLRAVDVFLVTALAPVATEITTAPPPVPEITPDRIAAAVAPIVRADNLGDVIEAVLTAVLDCTASDAASLFVCDEARDSLAMVGSRGYDRSGIGAEIALGEGVAGLAARQGRVVRVSDLSRVRRLGAAIRTTANPEDQGKTIPLPGLEGALSQLAVPVMARGQPIGVLLAESLRRLAYLDRDEGVLDLVASVAGPAIALAEWAPRPAGTQTAPDAAPAITLTHHAQDDSVFVDGDYIIKGVAGRLLAYLAGVHLTSGRVEFSNREIRLAEEMRLPGYRDNLETRLLLLQRRLEERGAPVRITRPGRGQIRLEIAGTLSIRRL